MKVNYLYLKCQLHPMLGTAKSYLEKLCSSEVKSFISVQHGRSLMGFTSDCQLQETRTCYPKCASWDKRYSEKQNRSSENRHHLFIREIQSGMCMCVGVCNVLSYFYLWITPVTDFQQDLLQCLIQSMILYLVVCWAPAIEVALAFILIFVEIGFAVLLRSRWPSNTGVIGRTW